MSNIKLFESKQVRSIYNEQEEKWYFSIVDVVEVLTDSPNPQVYWRVLKKRLLAEGNQTVTNCNGLKMLAIDGKMRMTDVANTVFIENHEAAMAGGTVAGNARKELEKKSGAKVVSKENFKKLDSPKELKDTNDL